MILPRLAVKEKEFSKDENKGRGGERREHEAGTAARPPREEEKEFSEDENKGWESEDSKSSERTRSREVGRLDRTHGGSPQQAGSFFLVRPRGGLALAEFRAPTAGMARGTHSRPSGEARGGCL